MSKSKNNGGLTLADLAARVEAAVDGDGSVLISGVATIESATTGHISFVANQKYAKHITGTGASALVLAPDTPCPDLPCLRHADPYLTFARVIDVLHPIERVVPAGIHDSAVVDADTQVADDVGVGPLCVVQSGARIGAGTQLVSSVSIGRDVEIGENCLLHPGVRILTRCKIGNNVIIHAGAVIGADGFGYATEATGAARKIQHRGWVELADDVEIGANATIDRGMMGPTRVGQGTKIDNLVQIAHNVQIGTHCRIVAQVGISGSTKLGNGVVLAGQVGLVGHIELGDQVIIAAQSGVGHSVESGKVLLGSPARDIGARKRIEASLTRLPDLIKRVRALEKKQSD